MNVVLRKFLVAVRYLRQNGWSALARLIHMRLLHESRLFGRVFNPPKIEVTEGNFKKERATILVVSHEASRTGAPILSLNIVQHCVKRYNVVALCLEPGILSESFRQAGAITIISSEIRRHSVLVQQVLEDLCGRFKFKYALINSIESREVLPALAQHFVPTISLIHEFASYTRPKSAFRDTLLWSTDVVFSASVTMENALAECPDFGKRSAQILPQGRCLVPVGEFDAEQQQVESIRIRQLIRPAHLAKDTVVVLGAGFVQLRKGVDLFIECAARVLGSPDGVQYRFVWVGKGYDPEHDVNYSVYLADQVRRANLQDHVVFIDETTAIEAAYEEADLLLLSSRLDPLPNVAIDAMVHAVPVLCFDKTTGIADFLIESGLKDACVARYLDCGEMAEKIRALARSPQERAAVADLTRIASSAFFQMENYVARLESLAQNVCERNRQEQADTQTILDSGLFQRDFCCPPHAQERTVEAEVRAYVRAWASGIGRRKPQPGFHPGIYLEQHGLTAKTSDPFADYLRAGRPEGPWHYQVIESGVELRPVVMGQSRVALHLHVHYPELLVQILERLKHNHVRPDLFVSVNSEEVRNAAIQELKAYAGKVVAVELVPNRGRDIGPLLTTFASKLLGQYDIIGHLHTKKSADVKDVRMGQSWYQFLLENLLGSASAGSMADAILAAMQADTSIGMVFPDDPHILGLTGNRQETESLAPRLGVQALPEHFNFPVGSMFWAQTAALEPLMRLGWSYADYPEEPLPYDGTRLHAVERLFALGLAPLRLRSASSHVTGLTR